MEAPRVAVLIFLLIFLFVSPDGPRTKSPHERHELGLLLEHERHALNVLNSSKYEDFNTAENRYLNITGLRKEDGYAWNLLPAVQQRAKEQVDYMLSRWKDAELDQRYKSSKSIDGGFGTSTEKNSGDHAVPFYQNVTGLVRGRWVRAKAIEQEHTAPTLNLTKLSRVSYAGSEYNRNITGQEGDLSFKFSEKDNPLVRVGSNSARELKAEMIIQDETSSGDGWDIILHGVHMPESGSILLTTTSDRFDGIFALPHFARSSLNSILAKRLLNQTIPAAIQKQMASGASPNFPWAASPNTPSELMFPTPHCEYVVLLQQHAIWPYGPTATPPYLRQNGYSTYLRELEHEIRYPSGAPNLNIPNIELSAVIFSPDCGFVLESRGPPAFALKDSNHLSGMKVEVFDRSTRNMVQLLALLMAGQIYLLIRQMKDASTPSTRSRISFYTIAMMGLGDGFICLSFITISLFIDMIFLAIVSTAFLAFLCVSFFGMKFLIDIWTVQAPERLERQRERERRQQETLSDTQPHASEQPPSSNTPQATVSSLSGALDSLPLPATTRSTTTSGATPVILPPDQDIEAAGAEDETTQATPATANPTAASARREMGAMYSRFYFILVGILFLSLNATTWPITLRSVYADLLSAAYLSFWVPQIKRNIIRNCRKALRWEFVVGQSILRLLPFYYFYAYPDNILYVKTDRYMMMAFTGWVWIQVCALISQEILGPRFFVPEGWAPPAYDYHPILREDDEETGASMPIGFTKATAEGDLSARAAGESKEHGKKTFDCAICMQDIDVPVIPAGSAEEVSGSALTANIFSRRAYMVTPCRHIFHSTCLEGWMRYKLQCPICRETLPPL